MKFVYVDGEHFEFEAKPGISIMQIATSNALAGIDAECGGSLSCATCHVYVDDAWSQQIDTPTENERAMLEYAEDPRPTSRLSCQIKYSEELDGLTVHIPESQ